MMLGVVQSNRENILNALHHYQHQLSTLESALMSNDESALASILNSAQARYQDMIH
jgi:prephenate dehydrogenase